MTNPGKLGSKKSSYEEKSFRPWVSKIFKEHPRASTEEIILLLIDWAHKNPDYHHAIFVYWAANQAQAYRRAEIEISPKEAFKKREAAKVEAAKRTELVKEKLKLLGLLTPNGKPLYQCTLAECKQFGGWYTRLHDKAVGVYAKPTDLVSQHWSEKQLREFQTWKD